MSFLVKLALLLVIFSFIVYVLKAISRFSYHLRRVKSDLKQVREQMSGKESVSAEMVRCVTCGTFVSSRDAIQLRIRDRSQVYCSEICLEKNRARA